MGTGASIPAEAKSWTEAEAKATGYTDEQIADENKKKPSPSPGYSNDSKLASD